MARPDVDQVFNRGCVIAIAIVVTAVVLYVIMLWREGVVPVQR